MELSYAELFLLVWALASSSYALWLRERHRQFVRMGSIALEACKFVLDDVADGNVTVQREGGKIKVVSIKQGEENGTQTK